MKLNSVPQRSLPEGMLKVTCSILLLAALGACSKTGESKTAGEKVDSAVAKTEQAATEAKNKVESSLASAGDAMKRDAQKAEESSKKMASTISSKVDDLTITASVTAALAKDPDLSALKIDVDTKDGNVTLNGPAPNAAAKDKAAVLAKSVKGVNAVDNKLAVKS